MYRPQIRKDRCRLGVSLILPAGYKSGGSLKKITEFFFILSNFLVRTLSYFQKKKNMKKPSSKVHNWTFFGQLF
jgi:hypothetical protein